MIFKNALHRFARDFIDGRKVIQGEGIIWQSPGRSCAPQKSQYQQQVNKELTINHSRQLRQQIVLRYYPLMDGKVTKSNGFFRQVFVSKYAGSIFGHVPPGAIIFLLALGLKCVFLDFFESFLDIVVVVENQRV